jgi:hypothetical protein
MVFLEGTAASLGTVETALTAFTVRARARRGIDLTRAPFDSHRRTISSPQSYSSSQALGTAMRASGVEAFAYSSARDREDGVNVGIFLPSVFGKAKPKGFETWHCAASRDRVDITKSDYFKRQNFDFPREQFLVNRVLPAPAV